ncbi:B3/B4 domain-containing protein [Mariniphaga sediminis]|uniref:B3/B4 domain-containing protein n=1 Tax=Mariniphaga sediminis TaxID=1628158 RepID=UPI0035691746
MIPVFISEELKTCVPELTLSCIECDVQVMEENELLWAEIDERVGKVAASLKVEQISELPAIAASRRGYKACGKDPARYRLSAEALLRRTVQGKGLYRVNNVVDLLNLVSLSTGFSIGGYDAEKIEGDAVFGIGRENEPYQGIGRGELNIGSLPVFRDSKGAFGTPTSDSVRTCVTPDTRRFLMIIIGFGAMEELENATDMAVSLLKKYAGAENVETKNVTIG